MSNFQNPNTMVPIPGGPKFPTLPNGPSIPIRPPICHNQGPPRVVQIVCPHCVGKTVMTEDNPIIICAQCNGTGMIKVVQ